EDGEAVDRLGSLRQQPFREGSGRPGFRGHPGGGQFRDRRRKAHRGGDVLDPGPAVALLGAAEQEGREAQAAADEQGADPPGPAARTAECSTAVVTMCTPGAARAAAPKTAALTASVPPEVKITSLGRAPKKAATRSRASSRATRAARPSAWIRPGSPGWASQGRIAS